jgi:HK97 gp10 family phage protein
MNDLERLVADLRDADQWTQLKARDLVEKAGERVRDEARRLAPRRGLPHYAKAITSEVIVERSTGTVAAEIGPERGGQGSLGHILEFGTSRTPPHAHLGPALDREAPRFERALSDILDPLRERH